jgi:hypothetical protein
MQMCIHCPRHFWQWLIIIITISKFNCPPPRRVTELLLEAISYVDKAGRLPFRANQTCVSCTEQPSCTVANGVCVPPAAWRVDIRQFPIKIIICLRLSFKAQMHLSVSSHIHSLFYSVYYWIKRVVKCGYASGVNIFGPDSLMDIFGFLIRSLSQTLSSCCIFLWKGNFQCNFVLPIAGGFLPRLVFTASSHIRRIFNVKFRRCCGSLKTAASLKLPNFLFFIVVCAFRTTWASLFLPGISN